MQALFISNIVKRLYDCNPGTGNQRFPILQAVKCYQNSRRALEYMPDVIESLHDGLTGRGYSQFVAYSIVKKGIVFFRSGKMSVDRAGNNDGIKPVQITLRCI